MKDDFNRKFPFPTDVTLSEEHNHRVDTVSALKYRDISEEVKKKFLDYFKTMSPSAALSAHKKELQEEFGEDYYLKVGDRSQCPDLQSVFRLFKKIFAKEYGDTDDLKENIEKTVSDSEVKAKYEFLNDGKDFIIAACTPLMERAHALEQSGHIVHIDASGNMDADNCRVFLLLSETCVGGLPLGILISSCESAEVLTAGLNLLKTILPPNAFGGAGPEKGPMIFMVDDCDPEHISLRTAFPETLIWLCHFHILQAVWRWLWDGNHNIATDDRKSLFYEFRTLLRTEIEAELDQYAQRYNNLKRYLKAEERKKNILKKIKKKLEKNMTDLQNIENIAEEAFKEHLKLFPDPSALELKFDESDDLLVKYPNFVYYVADYLERRKMWGSCYRRYNRNINTNNTVESAFSVLKDQILLRYRAFNVAQLFQKLTIELPEYYSRKILDILAGRYCSKLKYVPNKKKIKDLEIVCESENFEFTVRNVKKNTEYQTNVELGLCTCYMGKNKAPCKHQHFVILEKQLESNNVVPVTETQKERFHFIATGNEKVKSNWYKNLMPGLTPEKNEIDENVKNNNLVNENIIIDENSNLPIKNLFSGIQSSGDIEIQSSGDIEIQSSGDIEMKDDKSWEEKRNSILDCFAERLDDAWNNNPNEAYKALTKFEAKFRKLKTQSAFLTFLHTGGGEIMKGRKKMTAIPVQPTSAARRKSNLTTRRCQISGRPKKNRFDPLQLHNYIKKKYVKFGRDRSKQWKKPHCLSECVLRNITSAN